MLKATNMSFTENWQQNCLAGLIYSRTDKDKYLKLIVSRSPKYVEFSTSTG